MAEVVALILLVGSAIAVIGAVISAAGHADVSGTLTIAGTTVTKAEFEADLATLQSDD